MYGISADELHEMIVEDLKIFCRHFSVADADITEVFSEEIPLEQQIHRMAWAIAPKLMD